MNRHDHDGRLDVAADLLRAMYPDDARPAQRASVLDRIAGAPPSPGPAADPRDVAARALSAAYAAPADAAQRDAVLDAIRRARPAAPARRRPRLVWPARDTMLALASTVTAALVLGAVILAVRVETAQTPADPPGGLSAEEQRLTATPHHPPAHRAGVALVTPTPEPVAAPTAVPAVQQALAALQRGCEQGGAVSCRRLGTLYQRGRGVVASRARALDYYERACRAGDARACALHDMADHSLNDVDRDDRADAEFFSTLGL